MKKYNIIIFDLDGTITDSSEGIIKSIRHSLLKFGIEENDDSKLRLFIGPPLKGSFEKYYSLNGDKSDKAVKYYREYYSKYGIYKNVLYDGIKELLFDLKSENKKLLISTTKPDYYLKKILSYFEIDGFFTATIGSNMDGSLSDKSELIKKVLSMIKFESGEQKVMIGDRDLDIIGAKENNIDSIAVTYGYGSIDELKKAKPDHFLTSVRKLRELLIFN